MNDAVFNESKTLELVIIFINRSRLIELFTGLYSVHKFMPPPSETLNLDTINKDVTKDHYEDISN